MIPEWVTRPYEELRARRLAQYLLPHIGRGELVLDYGCGSMRITELLRTHARARVIGMDVININRTTLSMFLSSGEHLPLASNSVDSVVVLAVLHHVNSPRDMLRECVRVTRQRVIVAEDVYENPLEIGLLRALDWLGNRPVSSKIPLPYGFKTAHAWEVIFEELGLTTVSVERIRPTRWRPSRHRLFVLEKS